MKDTQTVSIGIDLHSNTSTIGYMNQQGAQNNTKVDLHPRFEDTVNSAR